MIGFVYLFLLIIGFVYITFAVGDWEEGKSGIVHLMIACICFGIDGYLIF